MNERIQQLAEQAGLYEGVFTRHDGVPCDLKGYSMTPEQIEKFAELIVRECAGKVDWILAEGGKTQGDLIKEYFGVEESSVDEQLRNRSTYFGNDI